MPFIIYKNSTLLRKVIYLHILLFHPLEKPKKPYLNFYLSVQFKNAFLFDFHGKTRAPFTMKLFSSNLWMCDLVMGYSNYNCHTPFGNKMMAAINLLQSERLWTFSTFYALMPMKLFCFSLHAWDFFRPFWTVIRLLEIKWGASKTCLFGGGGQKHSTIIHL